MRECAGGERGYLSARIPRSHGAPRSEQRCPGPRVMPSELCGFYTAAAAAACSARCPYDFPTRLPPCNAVAPCTDAQTECVYFLYFVFLVSHLVFAAPHGATIFTDYRRPGQTSIEIGTINIEKNIITAPCSDQRSQVDFRCYFHRPFVRTFASPSDKTERR